MESAECIGAGERCCGRRLLIGKSPVRFDRSLSREKMTRTSRLNDGQFIAQLSLKTLLVFKSKLSTHIVQNSSKSSDRMRQINRYLVINMHKIHNVTVYALCKHSFHAVKLTQVLRAA